MLLDGCEDKERWLEERERLDTFVVLAVNDVDSVVRMYCGREISEFLDSGDSMFAKMKFKDIDGGIPPEVECTA